MFRKNHPGKNRCPASEGNSSQPAAPLHCFGSDVPTVLTSLQQKGESLMGQDWGSRPGDPISPIPVFCVPFVWVLHYRQEQTSERIAILAVCEISRIFGTLSPFPALKSEHYRTSLPQ
ncbi:hypothetical protein AVEN_226390-1 [Araneus ventricosus]|uniref:Uncharacterized protein n=1 Tax=Araneus ventricosus TaxID=182803 RepID=A0A4Y2WDM6_ARAVE|nr:hypothetical protein AVEN_226390-1 [Araneus ventricosus]